MSSSGWAGGCRSTPGCARAFRALFPVACLATAAPSAADSQAPDLLAALRERVEPSASIEVEWAYDVSDDRAQKFDTVIEPELRIDLPFDLSLTAIGRMRADAYDRIEPGEPDLNFRSDPTSRAFAGDHVEFELRELYAEATVARAFVTLGKQQIVWGEADGLKVGLLGAGRAVDGPQVSPEVVDVDADVTSRCNRW